MDIYKIAFRRLKADPRSTLELSRETGVNGRTLHDMRVGKSTFDQVRAGNLRKIAAYYFPKQIAA